MFVENKILGPKIVWPRKTARGKNEHVKASVPTVEGAGNASTNHNTITFDYGGTSTDISDGDADIRCIIMAVNNATAAGATVTYS